MPPNLITGTVVGLNTESSLIAYGIRARKCYMAAGRRRRPLYVELLSQEPGHELVRCSVKKIIRPSHQNDTV